MLTILASVLLAIVAMIAYYLKNGEYGCIPLNTIGYAIFWFCIAVVLAASLK